MLKTRISMSLLTLASVIILTYLREFNFKEEVCIPSRKNLTLLIILPLKKPTLKLSIADICSSDNDNYTICRRSVFSFYKIPYYDPHRQLCE